MPLTNQQKKQLIKSFVKANRAAEELVQDIGIPGGPLATPAALDRDDPDTIAKAKTVIDYHKLLFQLQADL